jgi:hypothetical protein
MGLLAFVSPHTLEDIGRWGPYNHADTGAVWKILEDNYLPPILQLHYWRYWKIPAMLHCLFILKKKCSWNCSSGWFWLVGIWRSTVIQSQCQWFCKDRNMKKQTTFSGINNKGNNMLSTCYQVQNSWSSVQNPPSVHYTALSIGLSIMDYL